MHSYQVAESYEETKEIKETELGKRICFAPIKESFAEGHVTRFSALAHYSFQGQLEKGFFFDTKYSSIPKHFQIEYKS